jgi:hypothetical protein
LQNKQSVDKKTIAFKLTGQEKTIEQVMNATQPQNWHGSD